MPQEPFVKRRPAAPPGFFEVEAAGLRWLAEAEPAGGVRVARVLAVTPDALTLERIEPTGPTLTAARAFGRALARTHRSGAPWFGCPPGGWGGDGFVGNLPVPSVHDPAQGRTWGSFYSRYRLAPALRAAREAGGIRPDDVRRVERVCARLEDGARDLVGDPAEAPARLHGDLWSGNVLWTPEGAVLVDPAAHGGSRETDLAMLALFGLPHLDAVLEAYDDEHRLAAGWRDRVGLHQLFPLLVHAALFGGSYGRRAGAIAAGYA